MHNKLVQTTTVGIVAAGLLAAAGCTHEVMRDRSFVPAAEQAPGAVAPDTPATPAAAGIPAPGRSGANGAASGMMPANGGGSSAAGELFAPFEPMSNTPVESVDTPRQTGRSGTYVVVAGDSLSRVAKNHGLRISALAAANNLSPDAKLRIGQKLTIPGGNAGKTAVSTSSGKSGKKSSSRDTTAVSSGTAGAGSVVNGLYTVKRGDTIERIARRLHVRQADLLAANNLNSTSILRIGQKLVVPGTGAAAAGTAVTLSGSTGHNDVVLPPSGGSGDVNAQINALLEQDSGTAAPAGGTAAPVSTGTASGATPIAAPTAGGTGAAAAAPGAPDYNAANSVAMEVSKDISVEAFAAENKISVEALKALNSDWPKNGMFKSGTIVFIPGR